MRRNRLISSILHLTFGSLLASFLELVGATKTFHIFAAYAKAAVFYHTGIARAALG